MSGSLGLNAAFSGSGVAISSTMPSTAAGSCVRMSYWTIAFGMTTGSPTGVLAGRAGIGTAGYSRPPTSVAAAPAALRSPDPLPVGPFGVQATAVRPALPTLATASQLFNDFMTPSPTRVEDIGPRRRVVSVVAAGRPGGPGPVRRSQQHSRRVGF